jgi:probable HAF family extracellular repeat protein
LSSWKGDRLKRFIADVPAKGDTFMMTRRTVLTGTLALALTALLGGSAHAQSSYAVTELAPLPKGSYGSFPLAVNSKDATNIRVIGRTLSTTTPQGFFWSTKTGMLVIPGINLGGGLTYTSRPRALNSLGEVVGQSVSSGSPGTGRALYWNDSVKRTVNLDPNGTIDSLAADINDAGVIVGESWQNGGAVVYWQPSGSSRGVYGPPLALSPLLFADGSPNGRTEQVNQINANSDILGRCRDANGIIHAVVWKNQGASAREPIYGAPADLGWPSEGLESYPRVMNNVGHVAAAWYNGQTGTTEQLLTSPGSSAHVLLDGLDANNDQVWGINDSGTMAGHAGILNASGNTELRAALWTPTGRIQLLGTLGGTHSRAYGHRFNGMGQTINNAGQVIGFSTLANGEYHGFRWDSVNGMRDLNRLTPDLKTFAYLKDAAGITDEGYIVGSGITAKGKNERAYLLTPR